MSGCKYYKQKRQVSYDNGSTWQDVVPAEYQKGALIEADSSDCGYIVVERFVVVTGEYMCDGTTKYQKMKKQISYDGGTTWQDVVPAEYQKGALIETDSTDCGYSPTPSFDGKFKATYSNGTSYSAECDSSTTLTTATTKPSGYEYTAMTTANIGDCITSIDEYAFRNCSGLTSIIIPDSVTSIGISAFESCTSLTGITIPNSVTEIGISAFRYCSGLTSVNIPSGVTEINYAVFSGCTSLYSITIPDSVTSIGIDAFAFCSSLTSITIPNSVTTINAQAFIDCSGLTSVTIPDSVTEIGISAFMHCSGLTSVNIPSGVTSISSQVFGGCTSLYSITIPDSVTSIGNWAFGNCYALTSVNIPSGVTSIWENAFRDCSGLTSVTINAVTPPALGVYAFVNTNNCPIYVPAASINAYKSATNWSTYADRIQAIS